MYKKRKSKTLKEETIKKNIKNIKNLKNIIRHIKKHKIIELKADAEEKEYYYADNKPIMFDNYCFEGTNIISLKIDKNNKFYKEYEKTIIDIIQKEIELLKSQLIKRRKK